MKELTEEQKKVLEVEKSKCLWCEKKLVSKEKCWCARCGDLIVRSEELAGDPEISNLLGGELIKERERKVREGGEHKWLSDWYKEGA